MTWRDTKRWRDLALGLALLLGVAACTWQGIQPDGPATRRLYISGETGHVSDTHIAKTAAPYLDRPFFDIDIQARAAELEAIPWIAGVSVQRHWPDGVIVRVTEHRPVALWGDEALLAADYTVFTPGDGERPEGLPQLDGPEGAGERVYERYRTMTALLAKNTDARVARVALDVRGAWSATLDDGLMLRLGRADLEARVQRFINYALAQAPAAVADAGYVDLRYSDGFAVGGERAATVQENSNEQKA